MNLAAAQFVKPITGVEFGRHYTQGYIEIKYNEEWGSICDNKFEENGNNARVLCRMMDYATGSYDDGYKQVSVAKTRGRKWSMNGLVCSGNEMSFVYCSHSGFGNTGCRKASNRYDKNVGIRCHTTKSKKFFQHTLFISLMFLC